MRADEPGPERVELSMPVSPELFPLVRMLISVVASPLGFDYEAICDLRLAVDELVTLCAAGARAGARATLSSSSDASGLRVDCHVAPVAAGGDLSAVIEPDVTGGLVPAQLSQRILEVLADGHDVRYDPAYESRTGWLWKLRPHA